MKLLPLAAALLALSAAAAGAQEPLPKVVFGAPGYGGTGCPDGTAGAVRGFGNQAAFYVFDSYSVGDGSRSTDRKTCAVAIPVDVPEGVSVAVRNVAVRGAATLPDGLDAQLNVEAFAAGETGPVNEIVFSGASDTGFFRIINVPDDELDWSACGEDINLRVNTSLRTRGNAGADVSLNALIVYPLATKAC